MWQIGCNFTNNYTNRQIFAAFIDLYKYKTPNIDSTKVNLQVQYLPTFFWQEYNMMTYKSIFRKSRSLICLIPGYLLIPPPTGSSETTYLG